MSVPAWLADFQAQFGRALRAPLNRRTGTLRATTAAYERRFCDGIRPGPRLGRRERLAVYNRQYWLRLFGLMAKEFPITARLVGHWRFNELVTGFLLERTPSGWDIEAVPGGFEAFLERTTPARTRLERARPELPRAALLQAATIDGAQRRLFLAPADAMYRPRAPTSKRPLPSGRLQPSDRVAFVSEDWPLLALRRAVMGDAGEGAIPLPAQLAERQYWALARTPAGIGELALEAAEARLFELLVEHPLGEALARLERLTPPEQRPELPAKVQRWLARSVGLGFWRGLEPQS